MSKEIGGGKLPSISRRGLMGGLALAGGAIGASTVTGGRVFGSSALAAATECKPYVGDEAWRKVVTDKVAGRTLKVGFTGPAASEFYDIIEHGAFSQMRTYSDWFGVKWNWTYSSPEEHQDINDQVNTIEAWVTGKYDAVLVCTAGDFDSMQTVYAKATKAGTRVYQFNMPAELWPEDRNLAISNIGYNNTMQSGYLAGLYLAEKLNGQGNVVLIWGLPGHWSTARLNGFKLAQKEFPGLKIVAQQRGDYVRDKGLNAAMNVLQRDTNVQAIYGENEEMALGASQAIQALGLKPWDGKSGIITIGADGLKSGFESIKQGQLTATVSVGAVDQGRQSIETIFWNVVFGQVPPKVFNVRTQVVDKSNVDEPLAYVSWALTVPSMR
jgi:ABC-type sugar transport system substrate-binding protein